MKVFAQICLLSLWLFAVGAPSVITLIDDDNPVLVTNFNEEEQQESGKKSQANEKIINDAHFDLSLIAHSQRALLCKYHVISHIEYTLEILLPPPERIG